MCPTNSHVSNENHRGYRSWPKDKWIDLINILLRETNLNIYLAGGADEKKYFKEFYPLDKRENDISGLTNGYLIGHQFSGRLKKIIAHLGYKSIELPISEFITLKC